VDRGTPPFFSSVIGSAICPKAALATACACVAGDGKSAARTGSGHRPRSSLVSSSSAVNSSASSLRCHLRRPLFQINRHLQLYEAEALIALGQVAARRLNVAAVRERWEQARSDIGGAALVGADPDFLSTWTVSLRRVQRNPSSSNPSVWAIKRQILRHCCRRQSSLIELDPIVAAMRQRCVRRRSATVSHLQDSPCGTITGGAVEPKQHGSTLDA
jgi:hypothetical protein